MTPLTKFFTAGSFLAFFVFGFTDNLKGPILPEMFRSGEYSYSQGGTIVFAGYVGFIVATLAAGAMADVISHRGVLLFATICLCIGSLGFGTTHSYIGLILFMGVTGMGLGAIELGANGLIVELHREARGRYLNFLATFHGFGSLVVPLYAAGMIHCGVNWQHIYCSSIILVLPMLVFFWPRVNLAIAGDSLQSEIGDAISEGVGWDWKAFWRVGFTKPMICFYIIIAAYVAIELSVAAWMMEFLQHERDMSVSLSSIYLSSFFVLLMSGRLLGALFVERVDYLWAVFIAITCSSLCVLGSILGDGWLVNLLPFSGFFMSIVFPTITAAVAQLHLAKSGAILGLLFACGGFGGALGPWVVGRVSDMAGLTLGMASTLAFALVALGALLCLKAQPVSSALREVEQSV